MKAVLAFVALAAIIALSSAAWTYDNKDGEPLCTKDNMNKKFRNNWDPTRYWLCSGDVGTTAEVVRCPSETGFLQSADDCVDWSDWRWVVPENQPTASE